MDSEFIYNAKGLSRLNLYETDYGSETRSYDLDIYTSYTRTIGPR